MQRILDNPVLIGSALVATYWVLESLMHVFVFREGTVSGQIFSPEPIEFLHRSINVALLALLVVYSAVTIRRIRGAEGAVATAHESLRLIMDSMPQSVMVIGTDFRVQSMNATARRMMADGRMTDQPFCHEVNHQSPAPCSGEDHPCPLRDVQRTGKPEAVVHRHRIDGRETSVEVLASPLFDGKGNVTGIIEVSRDITDRLAAEEMGRKLRDRLFQEQKEQSILTLAGGIAHDFNNILMSVMGNGELLKMSLPQGTKEERFADNIIQGSQRMAHLTSQLLAYARGGMYHSEELSLNQILLRALDLSRRGVMLNVEVLQNLENDLWPVLGDAGQITQALMNIITNALEAMEKSDGRLGLSSRNRSFAHPWDCESHESHPAGDYVEIAISDSGPGIPEDLRQRIFEPFFTTKFMGRGLGLAAAAGIIRNHGGCIQVESSVDTGTTFHILLPQCTRTAPLPSPVVPTSAALPVRDILIVDDEEAVLTLLVSMLSRLGYRPFPASGGSRALELLQDKKDDIGLAILDIQMPDMDGRSLLPKLKSIKPGLKVIVASGYDERTALDGINPSDIEGFLPKPFRQAELQETLAKIVAPGRDTAAEDNS